MAFDPYDILGVDPVDFLFISHPHFDHCDPSSIKKLLKEETVIIAPRSCGRELERFSAQVRFTATGEKNTLDQRLTFESILAYNLDKFRTPTEVFHPKQLGGLGFIVELDG
ncbi:MAG: MBL fold metallo-hydrolase, partial [Patescibacteria group bacterium]